MALREINNDMTVSDIIKCNVLNIGEIKMKLINIGIFSLDNIVRTFSKILNKDVSKNISLSGFDFIIKLHNHNIDNRLPDDLMIEFFQEENNKNLIMDSFTDKEIELIFSDLRTLMYDIDYLSNITMIRI